MCRSIGDKTKLLKLKAERNPTMTTNQHPLVLCFVLLCASFSLSCQSEEKPEKENVIRPVRFSQVSFAQRTVERRLAAVTHAAVESNVSFRVGGKVARVLVNMGDPVSRNQPLAKLDDSDFKLQLQQVKANKISVQAQAENAKAHYDRVRALYVNKNASLAELDAARSQNRSAEAQVVAVQQQVELASSQLKNAVLRASGTGTIGHVLIEQGEVVGPGQPAMIFASAGHLEVQVLVPEVMIRHVVRGDSLQVVLESFPDQSQPGIVKEVGVMSVPMGTTYPVTIRLLEDDPDWRSGMAAEVIFNLPTGFENDRLVVPSVSVGEDSDGRYVFLLKDINDGIGKAYRSQVEVGGMQDHGIEVLSGLEASDLVVTAGLTQIQDGQQVRLLGL